MYRSLEIETPSAPNESKEMSRHSRTKALGLVLVCVIGAIIHVNSRDANTGSSVNVQKKYAVLFDKKQQQQTASVEITQDQIIRTLTCGQTVNGTIAANQRAYYGFTTPPSGIVTISTCNSNQRPNPRLADSIVYVFTGTTTTGTPLVECDDCVANSGCTSMNDETYTLITSQPPQGQTTAPLRLRRSTLYTIGVGGWSNTAGNFRLGLSCALSGSPTAVPTTRRPTTARPTFSPVRSGECARIRVRRDWFDLTQAERDVYLDGYLELRRNGKLAVFEREHIAATELGSDNMTFHSGNTTNNAFIPWHRYFIWELEEQIRALGGRFACFSLPYWDWSRAGDNNWMMSQLPMFFNNQSLGGNGLNSSGCVRDGKFSEQSGYQTTALTCLMREFTTQYPQFGTSATILGWVENRQMTFGQFTDSVEGEHGNSHMNVGGTLSNAGTATDDPVFFLLHSYVDLLWAMRQDCQDNHNDYPNLNEVLSYPEFRQQSWAKVNGRSYTVRDVLRTYDWNFTYHASNMKARSGTAMSQCTWNEIVGIRAAADEKKWKSKSGDGGEEEDGDENEIERMCIQTQENAMKKGLLSGICEYSGPLETCPGEGRLDVTLDELLNKQGVSGVKCLEDYRRKNYNFAKQLGYLRGLCNGASDPVCWRD